MEDGIFFEATQAEPLEAQAQSRAERRDQQTQRILEAAKACFVRSGFQGASMQQICAECGMSPGALYRYFPSKEAIVEAICEADRREDAETASSSSAAMRTAVEGVVDRRDGAYPAYAREGQRAAVCRDLRRIQCATQTIRDTVDGHASRRSPDMIRGYLGRAR